MSKKKTSLTTKIFAGLGIACVLGAAIFSVLWFVPSIHDKIWTPTTDTTTEIEDNTDNTNDETNVTE